MFGIGFLPKAPDTWGALVAVGVWWFLLAGYVWYVQLAVVVLYALLSWWAAAIVSRTFGVKDASAKVSEYPACGTSQRR